MAEQAAKVCCFNSNFLSPVRCLLLTIDKLGRYVVSIQISYLLFNV